MDVPEKQKTETQSIISSEILRQLHFPLQPIPDNKRCPSFCRVCGLCAQIKTHYLLPLLMLLYNDPIYRNLILPNIFFFFITRSSHTAEDQMHSVYLVFSTNSTTSLPDWEHQALSHTSSKVPEDTACILF